MNVLLLKAWLARFGPRLIGSRVVRVHQQDERSLLLELELDGVRQYLLISVLEEYPAMALVPDIEQLPEATADEGNFVKALNFHLRDYRLVGIQQQGFDRSVVLTLQHRDKYGEETIKLLRPELAGRSANLYLISDRGMVISIMKRVRRDRERVREVQTGKQLPPPPPLGKYVAGDGGVDELARQLGSFSAALPATDCDLLCEFLSRKVAGGDTRIWPQLESLIPVEYDLQHLHDFIVRLQGGEFNTELFGLSAARDENAAVLAEWLATRRKRGMPRRKEDPQRRRVANTLDQLMEEHRNAQRADELELHAVEMLGEAAQLDTDGKAASWLKRWSDEHPIWADEVDSEKSVHDNATGLLHLSQRLRRALPQLEKRIAEAQQQLLVLERLPAAVSPRQAQDERKDGETTQLERLGIKYRRFTSSDGLTILCGLNDRANDGLVRMYSGARHLWLHARDHAGSHVIVLEGGKGIPQASLEEAAVIAAYYSQGRSEPDVDVSYLPMNQLRRPRNAKPGQVLKLSERVLSVRPQRFEQLRSSLQK
jgi:predicted ribosome quality control (RQC) complex YloA/Tae2 family protein